MTKVAAAFSEWKSKKRSTLFAAPDRLRISAGNSSTDICSVAFSLHQYSAFAVTGPGDSSKRRMRPNSAFLVPLLLLSSENS